MSKKLLKRIIKKCWIYNDYDSTTVCFDCGTLKGNKHEKGCVVKFAEKELKELRK